jgi:phage terminase large subunit-like protein
VKHRRHPELVSGPGVQVSARTSVGGCGPALEDELTRLTCAGYAGGGSPDRVDAMVRAIRALFEKPRAEPRIRRL